MSAPVEPPLELVSRSKRLEGVASAAAFQGSCHRSPGATESRPHPNAVAPALTEVALAPLPAIPPAVVIAHLVAAQAVRAADASSAITRAATTTITGITTTAATGIALAVSWP